MLLKSFSDDLRGAAYLGKNTRIVIPSKYTEPSRFATVLAIADDCETELKVGDIVLCTRYPKTCQPFEHEGEKFVTVKEEEILARVEGL